MLFPFQLLALSLVVLSFLLVVRVPVTFASPDGWAQNKNLVLSGTGIWFLLVITTGILNFFVV